MNNDKMFSLSSIMGYVPVPSSVTKTVEKLIWNKALYRVDISMLSYDIGPALKKLFPNLPEYVFIEPVETVKGGLNIRYESITGYTNSTNEAFDMAIMDDMPVFIMGRTSGTPVTNTDPREVYLAVPRSDSNIRKLKELIKKMYKYSVNVRLQLRLLHLLKTDDSGRIDHESYDIATWSLRTFNDIIIPEKMEMTLKRGIDKYIEKRQWYVNNNIPNHFGILLHGVPGTGKSSIAQAIANYANAEIFIMNGDDITELDEIMNHHIGIRSTKSTHYRCLIIEDIDCGMVQLNREPKIVVDQNGENTMKKSGNLASILNCLDGLSAPSNMIYIMTTNHVEKLDPALIRPGRIDLSLEVNPLTEETFDKYMSHHYGDTFTELPENFKIKDGVTVAELQNLSMLEYSVDEIIKSVSIK